MTTPNRCLIRHGGSFSALLAICAAWGVAPALAQQSSIDLTTFPEPQVFRQIQLDAINCGRDNTSQPCDRARKMADPLMDHLKLSASCKDTLWDIRERAVVVPKNSYERREALNRDATDLTVLCKPATKPVGSGSQQSKEGEKKSGGLGGFLRGLGIGGGGGGGSTP